MYHRTYTLGLAGLILVLGISKAAPAGFSEDFSSADYRDPISTTADWNTEKGELGIWVEPFAIIGSVTCSGHPYGVTVAGDLALVCGNGGLDIVDIADPAQPAVIGHVATFDVARMADVQGDIAYVSDLMEGVQVVDISDPTAPIIIANMATRNQTRHVAVAGDRAYVGDRDGLLVFDVSDPAAPTDVGSVLTPGTAYGVALAGDVAYVADGNSGIVSIDISDPANPTILHSLDTAGWHQNVVVAGDLAITSSWADGISVFDVSDPANMTRIGLMPFTGYAWGLTVSEDQVYFTDRYNGLVVVDISDPTDPVLRGSIALPEQARAVAVAGELAFVAAGDGLTIVEVGEPVALAVEGSWSHPWGFSDVCVAGDVAFLVGASRLIAVDIIDLYTPYTISEMYLATANKLAIDGDVAYAVGNDNGLQTVDISDPGAMTLLDSWADEQPDFRDLELEGDRAYLTCASIPRVYIVDISDPGNIGQIGFFATGDDPEGICVSGDLAYVTVGALGLEVFDVSDPAAVTQVGGRDSAGDCQEVVVLGDRAYLADGFKFRIWDVSDPAAIGNLGFVETPGNCVDLAIAGDLAFALDHAYRGHLIDIEDSANPAIIDTLFVDWAFGMDLAGNHVFVVEGDTRSLQIVRFMDMHQTNAADNRGQSLTLPCPNDRLTKARLTTTQSGQIDWWLSGDGGGNWSGLVADGLWQDVDILAEDLRWAADLVWGLPEPFVACDELQIDWLFEVPVVSEITDVPNDQGRQVSIAWQRSGNDFLGSEVPITEYGIYRRIDDLDRIEKTAAPAMADAAGQRAYPPGEWHFVTTVPARCEEGYATVVPTLVDSTVNDGMAYTVFFVSAFTETPGVFFDSPPDSGYSVDNLAPSVPSDFMVVYQAYGGNELSWQESADGDFDYFRVYRGNSEDFEPSEDNLVHETIGTAWTDTSGSLAHHYKISAVDFSGNEGEAGPPEIVSGTLDGEIPLRLALGQNRPNPFNPVTAIRYELPAAVHVKLRVFDIGGRLMETLVDEWKDVGRYTVVFNAGDLPSGVYVYRLEAGRKVVAKKLVLMK